MILVAGPLALIAQDDMVMMELRAGDNVAFGGFAAASVMATKTFCTDFSVSGGIQYNRKNCVGSISGL